MNLFFTFKSFNRIFRVWAFRIEFTPGKKMRYEFLRWMNLSCRDT